MAQRLGGLEAIEAYEAALALYRGDLLDTTDVPPYRWLYDEDPEVALTFRSDLRHRRRDARLQLADLLASRPRGNFARAEELYIELCGEELDNERLWVALFRLYEPIGSVLGLESAVRRLRAALIELGEAPSDDIDAVQVPANLERVIVGIRARLESRGIETRN